MDWKPQVLAEGLEFPEGPICMGDGVVVFTEIRGATGLPCGKGGVDGPPQPREGVSIRLPLPLHGCGLEGPRHVVIVAVERGRNSIHRCRHPSHSILYHLL